MLLMFKAIYGTHWMFSNRFKDPKIIVNLLDGWAQNFLWLDSYGPVPGQHLN